ncbi:toxin-activating lysine-acyltransferase [Aurantiacibacter aquimixticola]|uniref:toxin-activating lysine-acyltransferase n=1 Tax=Aurantiacibacter aquimixticola TaxID=1958945 RepID=UPI001403DD9D|nr:toxin-activating lysine-acyltransferase [Aurantiacibacter aquimixticola]
MQSYSAFKPSVRSQQIGQNDMTSAISGDFGDAVLVLMKSPKFQDMPLRNLQNTLLEPMDRGQLRIARGKNPEGREFPIAVLGIAKLSDKLHEDMLKEPESVALSGDDWSSGGNIWFIFADGPEEFLTPFLQQVKNDEFSGQDVWIRGRGPDGQATGTKIPE